MGTGWTYVLEINGDPEDLPVEELKSRRVGGNWKLKRWKACKVPRMSVQRAGQGEQDVMKIWGDDYSGTTAGKIWGPIRAVLLVNLGWETEMNTLPIQTILFNFPLFSVNLTCHITMKVSLFYCLFLLQADLQGISINILRWSSSMAFLQYKFWVKCRICYSIYKQCKLQEPRLTINTNEWVV